MLKVITEKDQTLLNTFFIVLASFSERKHCAKYNITIV